MAEEQKQQDRQTLAQRLLEVDTAIHAVLLGGQSYKLGTRSVTRADLALLRQMRDDLAAQLQQEDNGNGFVKDAAALFFLTLLSLPCGPWILGLACLTGLLFS